MSTTIITVFNQEGCRRYLLPATDNADYSLVIYEKWFWLEEDLPVHLECIRGTWNLWPGASYHVYALYQDEYIPVSQAVSLRDGARFRIVTTEDESLELLVAVSGHLFTPSIRIPLASSHRVRFGTGAKSEVFIPFETGTDPVNLMLLRDWHDFSIVAREGTGYLNGRVIRQEMPLQYGDVIDLPEYSIQYLGEELAVLRGAEALDMLQAYNTGHDGSLCTIHANSAQDMLSRLEMMALMALPLPLRAVRMQIAAGVDLLVHLGRVSHRSRCVLEISELDGMEDGELRLNRLFAWDDKEERLTRCGEWKHTQKLRRYRRRSGPITGSSL